MNFAARLMDVRKDYVLKSETVRALRGVRDDHMRMELWVAGP